jgi:hypothetical protein
MTRKVEGRFVNFAGPDVTASSLSQRAVFLERATGTTGRSPISLPTSGIPRMPGESQ